MSSMTNRLAAGPPSVASPKGFTFGDPTGFQACGFCSRKGWFQGGNAGPAEIVPLRRGIRIRRGGTDRQAASLSSNLAAQPNGTGRMNLRSEALRLGIELDYLDARGRRRKVPDEAIA